MITITIIPKTSDPRLVGEIVMGLGSKIASGEVILMSSVMTATYRGLSSADVTIKVES